MCMCGCIKILFLAKTFHVKEIIILKNYFALIILLNDTMKYRFPKFSKIIYIKIIMIYFTSNVSDY